MSYLKSNCLILLFILLHFSCSEKNLEKPNIILIMADDLGMETITSYGGESYRTPEIDKLASKGIRFTNSYSTPLCTPSRVQIMTGKYNFRNYVGFGILDPNEKTFGHYMKEQGYATGITGKWQLYGNKRQYELAGQHGSLPKGAGFDEYCLWQVKDRGYRFKQASVEYHDSTFAEYSRYGPDLFTEFATDFIEKNRQKPFFLYYPMVLVHDPFQPTPDSESYDDLTELGYSTNDTTYFRDMMSYMDKCVGRIVDKVEELGIAENTIIMFTGDNGTDRKVYSKFKGKTIKGMKGHTIDAGIHVPFVAWWKGKTKPGINNDLIDFTDFLPTVVEAGGGQAGDTDGKSFLSLLKGDSYTPREWIFCSYDPRWGRFEPANFAMNKKYKYYDDGRFFNFQNDPEENNDLATQIPENAISDYRLLRNAVDSVMNN